MKNLSRFLSAIIPVFLFFVADSYAQSVKISGRITDKISGQPVASASIKLQDGTGAASGTDGKFEVRIARFPVRLKISHISYRQTEIDLVSDPKSLVIIEMEELVSEIDEVKISAKRLSILTENEDFTLQDFAFDKEHLWLLGYMKNLATRGRLWISDAFGDTIASIPVRNPERLYTDLFGNVHLVMLDSVYQVHSNGREILFPYAYERVHFFQTLTPIKAIFAGKLVYQDYLSGQQGLHTYYYSGSDQKPYFLNVARDSTEEVRQLIDYIYGENLCKLEETHSLSMWVRQAAIKYIREHKQTKDQVFYRQVRVPVFSFRDSLYIINLYKDSLLTYSPEGKFVRSVSIGFHRDSLLFDVGYRELSYLTDPVSQRIYLLQRKANAWKLMEFDPASGRPGRQILLPDFPGMTGITVYDRAVYFLYPEKKYPYYVRLYRYQL